jgi:uncharacterized GH25 family protein
MSTTSTADSRLARHLGERRERCVWLARALSLLLLARTSLTTAHDFWLQPSEYWVKAGTPASFTLQVGHGPYRQRSPIPARRITRFEVITPAGTTTDVRDHLHLGGVSADGNFELAAAGTHVLVLQTDDQAQTHLPALRFNDYLRAEGLTPALEQRERLHQLEADGSERYSRCAKTIVQAGPSNPPAVDQIDRRVGLLLEIVPEANPYRTPQSATLPVRVWYAGQPLAGALVKLTDLRQDAAPFETRLTDGEGRAVFTMPSAGAWLLNVIWTKSLPVSEETDFETVFSSLSFGLPEKNEPR